MGTSVPAKYLVNRSLVRLHIQWWWLWPIVIVCTQMMLEDSNLCFQYGLHHTLPLDHNLLKEKIHTSFLHGTPVFQSKSLILRSGNKSYQPFFFRKRKLEKASRQKHQLNPSFRKHDDNEAGIFVKLLRR
ncbi:hypothetical protein SLEP1_g37632 [Rubroshorea leprosula]|uniref:Uncharacterized protein n=1 Tax=Rubroshorea leprosula TaxID=152421 RepID=A0AAV5KVB9_9ROSI|nr:hypothetical protein SLEP1_g37632 [Rubroshorea leprosula]